MTKKDQDILDLAIIQRLSEMVKEDPKRLHKYLVLLVGKELAFNDKNYLDISMDADLEINGEMKRHTIKCTATIKEI